MFSGINNIEVNYVGASNAYYLVSEDSSANGAKQLWDRLSKYQGENHLTAILLCFGEIDFRNHIVRQSCVSGDSIMSLPQKWFLATLHSYVNLLKLITRS